MSEHRHQSFVAYGISTWSNYEQKQNIHHLSMSLSPIETIVLATGYDGVLAAQIAK